MSLQPDRETPPSAKTASLDLILGVHEVVLWQGKPDAGPFMTLSQFGRLVRTAVMIGLFLYILARLQKTIPPLWDLRMIVLVIFFQAVPSEILRSALRRRKTQYLLCAHRAVIVTDQAFFGRRVQSIPLTTSTLLEVQQGRTFLSILFPQVQERGWRLSGQVPQIGFERLRDGETILSMIRQIQAPPNQARHGHDPALHQRAPDQP